MARRYRLTPMMRVVNGVFKFLLKLGRGPQQTYILTVPGRNSGRLYSTPVFLVIEGNDRWLISPYGEVSWVRNARAAGQVTLSRGQYREVFTFTELEPAESAPILKKYVEQEPFPRPYFDAEPEAPIAAFEARYRAAPRPVMNK